MFLTLLFRNVHVLNSTCCVSSALQLYVSLVLVAMVAALSVAMLILCKNRSSKHTGKATHTQRTLTHSYSQITTKLYKHMFD